MQEFLDELDVLPKFLKENTGAEISGVRLFCTILYVYPISMAQRFFLAGADPNTHHVFHILTAMTLYYYNFGIYSMHFLCNVLASYVLLRALKPSTFSVALSFIFNMLYLMAGYASHLDTDTYTVSWTTSHAALTLKLIGLAWDLYDGTQKAENSRNEETALDTKPTLLELFGFVYYPPCLMTGPQISFRKYKYVTDGLYDQFVHTGWRYALLRLSTGILLTIAYPIMASYIPTEYFTSQNFKELSILSKMLLTAVWGQIILCRYAGVWMTAEGSCIISGAAFNGKDENGNVRWDGCTNILFYRLISVTQSRHYAESFHVSTNRWLMMYVYKRLKFLNNKYISHASSLAFLSIWHGLYSGYFMCFFLELIMVCGDALLADLCTRKVILRSATNQPLIKPLITAFTKFAAHYGMGCGLLAFENLQYSKYMPIYAEMYYLPLVAYLSCPLMYILLSRTLKTEKLDSRKQG